MERKRKVILQGFANLQPFLFYQNKKNRRNVGLRSAKQKYMAMTVKVIMSATIAFFAEGIIFGSFTPVMQMVDGTKFELAAIETGLIGCFQK